jgi:predicted Holliday junction resolvase-like endonuclease
LEAIFFGEDSKKELRAELVKAVSEVIIGRALAEKMAPYFHHLKAIANARWIIKDVL